MTRCSRTLSVFAALVFVLSVTVLAADEVAADDVAVGVVLEPSTLEDQFGESHDVPSEASKLLMAFEMKVSKQIGKWLETKDPSYLDELGVDYVLDIHRMPGPITKMFALPKMKKYPYRVLLIRDEAFGSRFPREEGKATIVTLDPEGRVAGIVMAGAVEEIEQALK